MLVSNSGMLFRVPRAIQMRCWLLLAAGGET